jgi:hypothetical protein
MKPLDNKNCHQSKILNVIIVDFQTNQALTKVIYNVLLKNIIFLNQDRANGRPWNIQMQK